MSGKPQARILFLSVPESLRGQVESLSQNDFMIDPDIPIPIDVSEKETVNLEELSWEMIISGMMLVIAAGPKSDIAEKVKRKEWIDYYRRFVLTVRPEIMAEFTEAAIMKARNGDYDAALEILDALRALFPSSPAVLLNRALVMEEKAAALERREGTETEATFKAADAAYTETLSMHPSFPDASFNAGFFYLGRKDFSRAKECFSRYVSIADDREKIERASSIIKDIDHNGLEDECFSDAYALIQQGNEEAGMLRIRDYIEKHPAVWNGWFVLGWALRRLSRWEEGAAAFGKAIELGGSGSDTRNELAICLMEAGDTKGARRELELALRGDPENIKIISNLGALAMKNGNHHEAAAFFRTVLDLDPEDPVARSYLHAL